MQYVLRTQKAEYDEDGFNHHRFLRAYLAESANIKTQV